MAAKKQASYGNESISMLKGADRVRLRPGVIFGSDGLDGCEHAAFEILSNSIDEAREGYGSEIIVTKYLDGSVEIEDFGRGIPVGFNQREGRYNWELVFCEMYAGGKYANDSGENYEYSLGLNGLGLCATQYASEYMDVTIYRDGEKYTLRFERGEPVGELKSEPYAKKRTGTVIRWRPDIEVFTDIDIPADYFRDVLKKQAIVNSGLVFTLRVQGEKGFSTENFEYKNGIVDYIAETAGESAMTPVELWECERRGRDREDKPEYKVRMAIAFTFSNRVSMAEYYHNSSWLEHGGSPERAVRAAFVGALDKFIKQTNKYTKNEAKITYADVFDSLVIVTNSFSTQTSYENQTKKAINNRFIQDAMTDFLKEKLEIYCIENRADAERIVDQVLLNKRSRETAERARVNAKKKLTANMDMLNRVEKFVDCRTKDVDRRELYIVEGDSALGSCKLGRDSEFQAIMPVRGKILNCLKADVNRILKSDIITDLVKVLGCGVEIKTDKRTDLSAFSLEALRWHKIIICTDADVDGFQIRTLILTMFYRLMPELIEQGKVYIAESPLYEITVKDKSYFAYSDKEKNDILEKITGKYHIARSKGLGENEPEMMWQTTMNPASRRLIQVLPEDAEATFEMFDVLLGDNLPGRKEYIAENGSRFLDMVDVS